jgi:hypothetical protein
MGLNRNLGQLTEVIKESGGNIGIGTGTTPAAEKFHVNSGAGNVPALFESTDPIAVVQFKDNNSTGFNAVGGQTNDLIFYSNNNINMRLNSSGNLGIGTANATGQSSDNRVLQIYGAGFANRAQIHFVNANTGEGTSDGTFIGIDSNKEFFINNTEGATIFENSGSERMRIFSSGNVFIGPSPSDNGNRLRVNGTTNSSQFNSMSGTVNAAPSTNTTFFTPTSTGLYLARIYLGGSPSQTWNAVIIFDFDATNILVVNQTNSINVSTVVSGTNIQVRQVGGITYTFTYQVLKIA